MPSACHSNYNNQLNAAFLRRLSSALTAFSKDLKCLMALWHGIRSARVITNWMKAWTRCWAVVGEQGVKCQQSPCFPERLPNHNPKQIQHDVGMRLCERRWRRAPTAPGLDVSVHALCLQLIVNCQLDIWHAAQGQTQQQMSGWGIYSVKWERIVRNDSIANTSLFCAPCFRK